MYHIDGQIIMFLPMGMYEVSQPAVLFAGYLRFTVRMGWTFLGSDGRKDRWTEIKNSES